MANADGSGPVTVDDSVEKDLYSFFSPDGSQVVFTSARNKDDGDIYVAAGDGSGDGLAADRRDRRGHRLGLGPAPAPATPTRPASPARRCRPATR